MNNINQRCSIKKTSKHLQMVTLIGLLFSLTISFSQAVKALDHDTVRVQKSDTFMFYTHEYNGPDSIYGIGVGFKAINRESKLGMAVTTSFNKAEVTATDGYKEDYGAWEAGIKLGLFSKISLYGEVGIDLTELIFHDLRYHDHCTYCDPYDGRYSNYYRDSDDIDAYFGFGAGVQLGNLTVTGFTRFREIDSRYWESKSTQFSGVQFSINF